MAGVAILLAAVTLVSWTAGLQHVTKSAVRTDHGNLGLNRGAGYQFLRLRGGDGAEFDREAFENVMKRRFFYTPSFQIHGGISGLYDYGPPGCSMKACMLSIWRDHFVVEDGMLEVDCATLTPEPVLRASGHVERFTDLMVRDLKTNECYRADRLLQDHIEVLLQDKDGAKRNFTVRYSAEELQAISERAGSLNSTEISALFAELQVRALKTNNEISEPYAFNLMFSTAIGPSGGVRGFLRPETAQGIFTNFRRLLDFNGGRLPFGAAQIGKAFRNEIAPKQGLLRVREFEMAEIEYFLQPADTTHSKFHTVAHLVLPLVPRAAPPSAASDAAAAAGAPLTLGGAVASGVIANEALAYFMGRTYQYLLRCGVRGDRVRFRQHGAGEMAHYASDCWDAEVLCSYGWIEVVGHADRACYDLRAHADATGAALTAWEDYPAPAEEPAVEAVLDRRRLGQGLRAAAPAAAAALEALALGDPAAALALQAELDARGRAALTLPPPPQSSAQEGSAAAAAAGTTTTTTTAAAAAAAAAGSAAADGVKVEITADMVTMRRTTRRVTGRAFYPRVVEPSFGVGRILYCALEHAFHVRPGGDERRAVLRLPAEVAPVKCAVMAVVAGSPTLGPVAMALERRLRAAGVACRADESAAAIGRRYARADELGVPFAVTVDSDTVAAGPPASASAAAGADAADAAGAGGGGEAAVAPGTVTVRERDSMRQIRVGLEEVVPLVAALARGVTTWADAAARYPAFPSAAADGSRDAEGGGD